MPVVEVRDLRKSYGSTRAVDGVSFAVEPGEIFGLLGPNGAGKTTTVEIVEGLRVPDSGEVRVLGVDWRRASAHDTRALKSRIGVQLQTTGLYPRLTVREVIDLFRTFFPGPTRSTDELIALVELRDKHNTQSKLLSGGQKQRLSVALALVNRPEIAFLDEPTTGLDPQARRSMWETIQQIQREGATVVLTTHYMEEAEVLCDRVAVMDQGQIIALDSPDALITHHFAESAIELESLGDMPPEGTFRALPAVTRSERENHRVTVFTTDALATLGGLTALAEAQTIRFNDLRIRRATLEDVFLKLTGRHIRD
jgi:ABC-2 type transport system ATP-binding protein